MRREGEFFLNVSESSTASSLYRTDGANHQHTQPVAGETLELLLSTLGWSGCDLIKMDIEGAEIEVLRTTSDACLASIKQFTIEFHDFCGLTPIEDVKNTLQRLKNLGFAHVRMSRFGHQDTWLINRKLCKISNLEYLYIRYFIRNWNGVGRLISRSIRNF